MSAEKPVLWVDITNAPHVRFFAPLLRGWSARMDWHVTARDHSNTIALLEEFEIPHTRIGGHGTGKVTKPLAFWLRVLRLAVHLRKIRPVAGVGQSSFHLPVAGALAGVPTLYTNDNEHAKGNGLAFQFATRVLLPEPFPDEKIPRRLRNGRAGKYPGIKEGIYLVHEWQRLREVRREGEQLRKEYPRIYVRPEPIGAQYYQGEDSHLRELLGGMSDTVEVHVLPRSGAQATALSAAGGNRLRIRRDVVSLDELASRCTLFVSAGGTMGREAAFLGIPVVSIYKKNLLAVDQWLVEKGLLVHEPRASAAMILSLARGSRWNFRACEELARKGSRAVEMLTREVEVVGSQAGRRAES